MFAISSLSSLICSHLIRNEIAEQLERSVKVICWYQLQWCTLCKLGPQGVSTVGLLCVQLYSQLVCIHSQADQYGSVRLAIAAMLRRVGPLLLVMCDEAGPLPLLMAPEVDIQTMATAAVQ